MASANKLWFVMHFVGAILDKTVNSTRKTITQIHDLKYCYERNIKYLSSFLQSLLWMHTAFHTLNKIEICCETLKNYIHTVNYTLFLPV